MFHGVVALVGGSLGYYVMWKVWGWIEIQLVKVLPQFFAYARGAFLRSHWATGTTASRSLSGQHRDTSSRETRWASSPDGTTQMIPR